MKGAWAVWFGKYLCERGMLYGIIDAVCLHLHFKLKQLKGKGLPQQAEVVQGVPGRLRPRIFLTFGTTRVVGSQSYAPAAFTPGEIPGTHIQGLSQPQGTWFRR